MSFVTEEQELMLSNVREFVQTVVKPRVMEINKTGEFPHDLWKLCAEMGLLGLGISEDVRRAWPGSGHGTIGDGRDRQRMSGSGTDH